jgi:hypothetical protein
MYYGVVPYYKSLAKLTCQPSIHSWWLQLDSSHRLVSTYTLWLAQPRDCRWMGDSFAKAKAEGIAGVMIVAQVGTPPSQRVGFDYGSCLHTSPNH